MKIRNIATRYFLPVAAVVLTFGMVGDARADLAADLAATATAIKADLADGQTAALPIFAIMFGVPLVISFFKRVAH